MNYRTRIVLPFLTALFFLMPFFCAAAGKDFETPTLQIPRVSRPPTLEEFLNGTPREAEAEVTDFRQFDPKDGAPVSQPTAAYLSYDDTFLYVGWVCKDEPGQIRAHMMKRDQLLSEDRVSIGIDTFHDHRRNYWFDVNPFGIQMDGITTDGMDDFSFDTLWYSEGRLTPDGYVVLQKIPFKSLRFPKTPVQNWGIVLNRMIQRNNEMSCWPYISRRLLPGWTSQFGHLEGVERISPGRNLQFIPYGFLSHASFLDADSGHNPRFAKDTEPRAGLDAKMVLRDALTLDLALNPDFSQVESDEPQVTVNQRYEVFFPEKRPFFIENASLFQTPERLFFSRRIADPDLGMRLSGKFGPWALGALAIDDGAPGLRISEMDPDHGRRAAVGVVRLQRELGRESRIGTLVTSQDFASSLNRVVSVDGRLRFADNWSITTQAAQSFTRRQDGQELSGPAYLAEIARHGKSYHMFSTYRERGRDFRSEIGFIPRVDMRQMVNHFHITARPETGRLVSWGPSIYTICTWDTKGELQDWEIEPTFDLQLTRMTHLRFERSDRFERFEGLEFRKGSSRLAVASEWFRWLAVSTSFSRGSNINYYPAPGIAPFLGQSEYLNLETTVRPTPQLIMQNTYILSRLRHSGALTLSAHANPVNVFNNHIARSKINYQFTPALSLRAIFDYNSILPNASLVSLEKEKRVGADLLLTYMVNPGTALHVGFTDLYENLALDPAQPRPLYRIDSPETSVGRQVFIKLSYLFRM
jgi:hypothetical protein